MMDMRRLINTKRTGGTLQRGDLEFFVGAICDGTCADEQLGAMAMAICFAGLDPEETLHLTELMAASGGRLQRTSDTVVRLDKHSTGGVGDKVSLALGPMLAACGAHVPMVSGRGLLHTGGTLDKMESIPGCRTDLDRETMDRCLERAGVFIAGPTADLVPADRRLYAVRDQTDTVESIPLIIASILSKKLAEDLDALVLDIKVGRGAFMRERAQAEQLAAGMVRTASVLGLRVAALLTAMDEPLGRAVGNALEVREVLEVLDGEGSTDLRSITLSLGVELLVLGGLATDIAEARKTLETCLTDGTAKQRFGAMVEAQGGDPKVIERPDLLPRAPVVLTAKADHEGFVAGINAFEVGRAVMGLGAGRARREDPVDPVCGIYLQRKVGEPVEKDEPIFEVHAQTTAGAEEARQKVLAAITMDIDGVTQDRLVLDRVRDELDGI